MTRRKTRAKEAAEAQHAAEWAMATGARSKSATRRKTDAAQTVSVRLYADELEALLRWAPPPTDGSCTRGVTEALRRILAATHDMEPTVSMTPRYVRTACLASDIAPTVYAADADGMPTRLLDAGDVIWGSSIVWVMRRG